MPQQKTTDRFHDNYTKCPDFLRPGNPRRPARGHSSAMPPVGNQQTIPAAHRAADDFPAEEFHARWWPAQER